MRGDLAVRFAMNLPEFRLDVAFASSEPHLALFGRSGSGKTTILETIAGWRHDAVGEIRHDETTWLDSGRGVVMPPERRGVGYVPQDLLLFPHRDVLGNLTSSRRRHRPAPDLDRIIRALQLEPLLERSVNTLSGGERRRVALGRALRSGPELLLLDEPMTGLDLSLRRRILSDLCRVREEFSIPTILVSHDPAEVHLLSREVLVVDQGRIVARGSPSDVLTEQRVLSLARLERYENLIQARVVEATDSGATVEIEPGLRLRVIAPGLRPGVSVSVGVDAEDLILAADRPTRISARNVMPARVREIRPRAGDIPGHVVVTLGETSTRIIADITEEAVAELGLRPGARVHLVAKVHSCRLLSSEG